MHNHVVAGFIKEAGLLTSLGGWGTKLFRGGKSGLGQIAAGGVRSHLGTAGEVLGRAGGRARGTPLVNRAANKVRNRILTRGGIGVAVGAGSSMIGDKLRGEDINWGKAIGRGALGGAVGGVLGTTAGARGLRKAMSAKSTPNMGFKDSMNPAKWLQKSPDTVTKLKGGRKIVSQGRTAWGNLGVLDKAMVAQSGYESTKALVDKEHEGRRMEGFLGGIASGGAIMGTSRWKGMRNVSRVGTSGYRKGGVGGHLLRTGGVYAGAGIGGSMLGRGLDRAMGNKPPEGQDPYA